MSGLKEPVEERAAVALVDRHVPGVLAEAHRRLTGEPDHAVGLLLAQCLAVQFSRPATANQRAGQQKDEEERSGGDGEESHCVKHLASDGCLCVHGSDTYSAHPLLVWVIPQEKERNYSNNTGESWREVIGLARLSPP